MYDGMSIIANGKDEISLCVTSLKVMCVKYDEAEVINP